MMTHVGCYGVCRLSVGILLQTFVESLRWILVLFFKPVTPGVHQMIVHTSANLLLVVIGLFKYVWPSLQTPGVKELIFFNSVDLVNPEILINLVDWVFLSDHKMTKKEIKMFY